MGEAWQTKGSVGMVDGFYGQAEPVSADEDESHVEYRGFFFFFFLIFSLRVEKGQSSGSFFLFFTTNN